MKTAMQELIDYMKTYFHLTDDSLEMFDKALEKEKEQIIDAHEQGREDFLQEISRNAMYGKGYYNETYNQNK